MGFKSYFSKRGRDHQRSPENIVASLQQQIEDVRKREEYFQRKVDEETKRARANAAPNKVVALAALKRKKVAERDLRRAQRARARLQIQVKSLNSAMTQRVSRTEVPVGHLGEQNNLQSVQRDKKPFWPWKFKRITT
ncbi:hypothetical protein PHLGIDRAFT_409892 [Phlebiopsis gigantea 11061_1 CR5-6]|uniref:Uncharacterized protein n=1 Tax=Phlebiopsis gigantea (strain 11061_1 CR5-6) TaxID=745531 RepID=A0A0C3NR70_PHLG1|nr:hypothetical protein PHLGIDRAFT_409892 [Phlebiopsis gigantea 11061_1 CR5-6]